jgi:hypothetical protein
MSVFAHSKRESDEVISASGSRLQLAVGHTLMVADRIFGLVGFHQFTRVSCGNTPNSNLSTSTFGFGVFDFPPSTARLTAWADDEGSALTVRTALGEASGANHAFLLAKQEKTGLWHRTINFMTSMAHNRPRRGLTFIQNTLPTVVVHFAVKIHAFLYDYGYIHQYITYRSTFDTSMLLR